MTRVQELTPEFVEYIPEHLSEGVLYVSMRYATAAHLCCSGCGMEVVTTLSPTDWQLSFDGRSISLTPSIGNWNFPCRSHYWITENRVEWSGPWSKRQIAAGRIRDRHRKQAYFGEGLAPEPTRHGLRQLLDRLRVRLRGR